MTKRADPKPQDKKPAPPEKKECAIAEGKQHFHEGELCEPGDKIDLTERQAKWLHRKQIITENPFK